MLKAHSWADVSVKDMHLRQPDGSLKQDTYKAFKDRVPIIFTLVFLFL